MASSGVSFLICGWYRKLYLAFCVVLVCAASFTHNEKQNGEVHRHSSFQGMYNRSSTGLPVGNFDYSQGDYRDGGASVLFTCDTHISFVNLSSHKKELLIDGLKHATFLDFFWNHSEGFIFWSDYQERKIYRAPYTKSGKKAAVVSYGIGSISGIAVDWIGKHLYWLDSKHKTLEVALFDGSQRSLLLKNLLKPRGLALDPFVGFLFWADFNSDEPRIERCDMDGSNRQTIVVLEANTSWPNDVTIDYNKNLIYWIDGRSGCIHRSDYYGNNREDVHCNRRSTYAFSVSLFEDMLFWSDTHTSQLSSLNLTTKALSIVTITYKQLYSVKVFHSSRQKQGANSCSKDNGNCSHLCLLGDSIKATCSCPYGMVFSSDNRTCTEYKGLTIYSVADELHTIQIEGKISPGFPTYHVHETTTDGILRKKHFYWIAESNFGRLDLNDGNSSTLLNLATLTPVALEMDDLSGNIYLLCAVDGNTSVISACTRNGDFFTTILWDNMYEPISLTLDVHNRLLYWSHYFQISEGVQCILESSLMDGTQRRIHISYVALSSSHCPRSLVVLSHFLCWLNNSGIQCTDTRNNDLVPQLKMSNQSLDIVSLSGEKDHLFFVAEKKLYSMNILGGLEYPKYITSLDKKPIIFGVAGNLLTEDYVCAENIKCDGLCLPLGKNMTVCPPITGAEKFLVLSTDYGLKGLPLQNETIPPEIFLAPFWSSHAVDVDFNVLHNKVYWIDSSGSISSARRDGRVKKVILPSSEGAVAFCVDWIADNIYWVTSPASVIKVARSDGRHPIVILHKDLRQPSAILVDPISGHLIWSACCSDDGTAYIEKSSLLGSQRSILVQGIFSIADIAVDPITSTVFWADPSTHVIEYIKIDGSGRKVLMLLHSPYSITLSQSSLYWTERNNVNSTILYAPKHNLSERNLLKEGLPLNVGKLRLFDIDIQPGSNPCSYYNGFCQQLCFYEGDGKHSCACAFSMLSDNKKTCTAYNSVLLLAHQGSIESFSLESPNCVNPPLQPLDLGASVKNLVAIAVHTASNRIFFSDLYTPPYLFYINMNGGGINPLLKGTNPLQIEGLVYSNADEYVYWTESISPSVCRLFVPSTTAHQDTKSQVEVVVELDSVDKPRGIVVDECSSFILWTNWKEGHPSIEKASINGSARQVLIKEGLFRPNGLALSRALRKIFWADARTDGYVLGMANLDGSSVLIVAEGLKHHPYAVAVHQYMLLWTDWSSGSLFYTNWMTREGPFLICSGFVQPMGLALADKASAVCTESIDAVSDNAEDISGKDNVPDNSIEPNCSALCQNVDPCTISEYLQSVCHCLYSYNQEGCYGTKFAPFGFLKDNVLHTSLIIGLLATGLLCVVCAFLVCRRTLCSSWVIGQYMRRHQSAHSKESLTLLSDTSTCNQQHTSVSAHIVKGDPERNFAAYTSV